MAPNASEFVVNSKLIQHYLSDAPVPFSSSTRLKVVQDKDGELQIFTVGTDSFLYCVSPDKSSRTGWRCEPMNAEWQWLNGQNQSSVWLRSGYFNIVNAIPCTGVICHDAMRGKDGELIIAAATNPDARLWYCKDQRFSNGWQYISSALSNLDLAKLQLGYSSSAKGEKYMIYALQQVGTVTAWQIEPFAVTGWVEQSTYSDIAVGTDPLLGPGVYASSNVNADNGVVFISYADEATVSRVTYGGFTGLTAVTGPNNTSELFAIWPVDQSLQYLKPSKPGSRELVRLNGNVPVSQIAACCNPEGYLEVFAIGVDNFLYHVRQAPDLVQPSDTSPDPAAAPGWTHFTKINSDLQFAHFDVAVSKDGYCKVFAVPITANALYQVWQDPATSDWKTEEIEIPSDAQQTVPVRQTKAYLTEITVQDELGLPSPNTVVSLSTPSETPARINGRSYNLGPVAPLRCKTDSAGKITIVVEADSLTASIFQVSAEFMEEGEFMTVEPNAYIQEKLASIDAAGLQDARNVFDGQTKKVVKDGTPEKAVDAACNALNRCMSLAGKAPGPPDAAAAGTARRYLSSKRPSKGVRYFRQSIGLPPNRIEPSAVPEQHWRLKFDAATGLPHFEMLSRDDAQSLVASYQTMRSASSLPDWFDADWGDVWQSIKSVAEIVVTTLIDEATNLVKSIEAKVQLLIDGITYLYEQTINLVEQVFDVVTGVFESIGTFFQDLFDWLGFLFDWDDILLTQKAVRGLVNDICLPWVKTRFASHGELHTLLRGQMQSFQGKVDQVFADLLNSPVVGANNTLYGFQQASVQSDPELESQLAGTNIPLQGFMDNVDGSSFKNPAAQSGPQAWDGQDAMDAFMQALESGSGSFVNAPSFAGVQEFFQSLGNTVDQFLQQPLQGLINLLQAVVKAALTLATNILDAIFLCIQKVIDRLVALLNEPLDIPFVSELFSLITNGAELTMLDLIALVVAAPATIAYKFLLGEAPFAGDNEVQLFFRSARQAMGLSSPEEERDSLSAVDYTKLNHGLAGIAILPLLSRGALGGLLDVFPPQPGLGITTRHLLSFFFIGMEVVTICCTIPVPVVTPGFDDAEHLETVAWMVKWLSPFLNSLFMFTGLKLGATAKIMRNSGILGNVMDSVLGYANLGLWFAVTIMQPHEVQSQAGKTRAARTAREFFIEAPAFLRPGRIFGGEDGLGGPSYQIFLIVQSISEAGFGVSAAGADIAYLALLPAPKGAAAA